MTLYAYCFVSLVAALLLGNLLYRLTRGRRRTQIWFNTAVLALLCAFIVAMDGAPATYLGVANVNPLSAFFMLLFTLGMLLVNVLAHGHSQEYPDFALLGSFALVGAYLVASGGSLVVVFLGLETVSVPTAFIMLASRKRAVEPAVKFFVMSSVALAVMSFAIVMVYGATGSVAVAPQQQSALLAFAAALFIASLGAGASVFPFCAFAPDVYQGAEAHVAAMLGGVNKGVWLAALIQIAMLLFVFSGFAFGLIEILAALTMLFGSLVALMQNNLRRMLAYASISQAGYVLVAISAESAQGVAGGFFLMFAQAFVLIGALGIVAWLERNGRDGVDDLIGLYKENGLAAAALSVFLLSIVGLPFTAGFVGEFAVFAGALGSGLLWLAVVGAFSAALTAYCFARAITSAYTDKADAKRMKIDAPTAAVVVFCLLLTILLGVYPQPLFGMAQSASGYLFGILVH